MAMVMMMLVMMMMMLLLLLTESMRSGSSAPQRWNAGPLVEAEWVGGGGRARAGESGVAVTASSPAQKRWSEEG